MKPLSYLAVLLGLSLPVMALAYAVARTWAMEAPCGARGYSDDAYLAYCQNAAFGSYEHAAYDRQFEPRAVARARAADVVFLGNSRLQVAFSRPATDRFFAARRVSYHLLGFGYGESAPFAFRVLHGLGLKPKVLIVNVAPFFVPVSSPAAAVELRYNWKTRIDVLLKSSTQSLHRFLCGRDPSPCPGGSEAVFRSRTTGQWFWAAARSSPRSKPFAPPPPFADAAAIASDAAYAERLLAESGLRAGMAPGCVILTQVPEPSADYAGLVEAVARRTGAVAVLPAASELPRLATFDGSHLDRASGDAWAEAFFREAAPAVDRCLGPAVRPAAPAPEAVP